MHPSISSWRSSGSAVRKSAVKPTQSRRARHLLALALERASRQRTSRRDVESYSRRSALVGRDPAAGLGRPGDRRRRARRTGHRTCSGRSSAGRHRSGRRAGRRSGRRTSHWHDSPAHIRRSSRANRYHRDPRRWNGGAFVDDPASVRGVRKRGVSGSMPKRASPAVIAPTIAAAAPRRTRRRRSRAICRHRCTRSEAYAPRRLAARALGRQRKSRTRLLPVR